MTFNHATLAGLGAVVFAAGVYLGQGQPAEAQGAGRVFELRTYTAHEGKLDPLLARFRDHTVKLFEKHGIKVVGFFVAADAPQSSNTMVYILGHESREAAKKSWDAFRSDPEWVKVRDASEANGPLVSKVESVYLTATDFSPIK